MTMHNLLAFSRTQLRQFLLNLGEKPFRADQLIQWIHQYGITDFDQMSNLSKTLRQKLAEVSQVKPLEVVLDKDALDDTRKWLLRLYDGNCIETVYIPERGRGTLCVSSQVGCALNCSFCSTATQGFNRNLDVAEIIGQVWHAARALEQEGRGRKVTNVVMMGMGEPLLNYDNVIAAMDLMLDDFAYNLSKYRVTLSTSGVVPAMKQLKLDSPVALAVSLHAPNDVLRNQLVPINKKYPIAELLDVCRDYFPHGGRRKVTFEYVMLSGVNDSISHAKQLARVLEGVPAKVNLIPFNPFPQAGYERSKPEVIVAYSQVLIKAGLVATIRKTRGEDMDAACGQLVGEFQDRTPRSARFIRSGSVIPVKQPKQGGTYAEGTEL